VLRDAERARAEATLARVLLWQGRIDEATQSELSCPDADDDTKAYVGAIGVRVALAGGDLFTAGQRARGLLDAVGLAEAGPHAHRGLARVIALSAHTRVLMATGDLASVEERMQHLQHATQFARTPLRFARMRLLLHDVYRRAGRTADAERELAYLRRIETAAPPLLRDAIARCARRTEPAAPTMRIRMVGGNLAAALVTVAQEQEDDRTAITKLMAFTAEALQASRVEVCSSDARSPRPASGHRHWTGTRQCRPRNRCADPDRNASAWCVLCAMARRQNTPGQRRRHARPRLRRARASHRGTSVGCAGGRRRVLVYS
jgi:hypothetical protein